ncbi:MAG: phosphatase PAP2 family protein [Ilumatobacter sp.]|uniref:phosphatase PAP2 family protein n=1 Tax=Ilumatobacter sp. TaxID=1967498 RepID=UPI003299E434
MIPLIVLGVAAVVATILVSVPAATSSGGPLDVEPELHWLARRSPRPVQRVLHVLDRRVVGGVVVGVSFIVVFSAALVVGWIFTGIDDATGIARWDSAAAEFGRDRATDTSTRLLDQVTNLGGTMYVAGLVVLVGVYHGVQRKTWGPMIYLAAVGVGIVLLNNGLKLIVDRDRPDIAQLAGHSGSSFPSGHSATAAACWAALAFVVTLRRTRRIRIAGGGLAAFVAAAVAATRVLLGVHWLSDVVAGVFVGWAWSLLVTIALGGRSLRLGDVEHEADEQASAPDETTRDDARSTSTEATTR